MSPTALEGAWHGEVADEVWIVAADGWWGVGAFVGGPFEALRIPADGSAYVAMPDGSGRTSFPAVPSRRHLQFEDPSHDFPSLIRYSARGGRLRVRIAGPGGADAMAWWLDRAEVTVPEAIVDGFTSGVWARAPRTWPPDAAPPCDAWVTVAIGALGAVGHSVGQCPDGASFLVVWRDAGAGWEPVFAAR
jgi:hypothetical protein